MKHLRHLFLALATATCFAESVNSEPLRIFVTTATHNENLADNSPTAYLAADRICNIDEQAYKHGEKSAVYKALIAGDGRYPATPGSEAKDWPLQPLTNYYVQDDTRDIITTNDSGTFNINLAYIFSSNCYSDKTCSWTGLKSDGILDTNNCNNGDGNSKNCSIGDTTKTNSDSISYNTLSRDKQNHFYCAQQPRTTDNKLYIFLATNGGNGWHGDLKTTARNAGADVSSGEAAADYYCNISFNRPNTEKTYKALIGSKNRYGCDDSGCGGTHAKDWPLEASTSYINSNGQLIGTTSDLGIFPGTFQNPIGDGPTWTGLSKYFQEKASCKSWTSNSYSLWRNGPHNNGMSGEASSLNSDFINIGDSKCMHHRYLYCVEVK